MSTSHPLPEAAPDAPSLVLLEKHAGELDALKCLLEECEDARFTLERAALGGWASGAVGGRGFRGVLIQAIGLGAEELHDQVEELRGATSGAIIAVCDRQRLELLRCVLDAGGDALLALEGQAPSALAANVLAALHARQRTRALELELECAVHMTNHDRITNLENRYSLERRLAPLLATAARRQRKLGVLLVATDGLDSVNDSFGQQAGNQLLRDLAERLLASIRRGDDLSLAPDEDAEAAVSHLGGSDFTVLLSEITKAQDAARVAQRILDALAEAFLVEGQEVFIRTSIGITVFPFDGPNADALQRNARSAKRRAEKAGGNAFRFYAKSMNNEATRRLKLGSLLHRALERDEFSLHYQPLRAARSGQLMGMEALLRWSTEDMGQVSPAEFVPIAEDTNLIVPIGEWVLRRATQQYRQWLDSGYRPARLAVNLSGRQLGSELVATVSRILAETDMSSNDLELEITETTIAREDQDARNTLEELRDMGIGLALDDFGTGFSTLTHLSNFPVDRLKIDRSFISEIGCGSQGSNLAAALIAMAHSLDLGVVAEGVETVEQANFLRRHGCDELQGFLLGRPMPAAQFEPFLERTKRSN